MFCFFLLHDLSNFIQKETGMYISKIVKLQKSIKKNDSILKRCFDEIFCVFRTHFQLMPIYKKSILVFKLYSQF